MACSSFPSGDNGGCALEIWEVESSSVINSVMARMHAAVSSAEMASMASMASIAGSVVWSWDLPPSNLALILIYLGSGAQTKSDNRQGCAARTHCPARTYLSRTDHCPAHTEYPCQLLDDQTPEDILRSKYNSIYLSSSLCLASRLTSWFPLFQSLSSTENAPRVFLLDTGPFSLAYHAIIKSGKGRLLIV